MSLYYRWKKIYKKNVIGQAINGQSEEGECILNTALSKTTFRYNSEGFIAEGH